MKYFLIFMCFSLSVFAQEISSPIPSDEEIHAKPKVKIVSYNYHSFLLFDDKYLVHNPDCTLCACKPKVIFNPKDSIGISSENMPLIMQDLHVSKYRNDYFPNLYYWMED